eukprot:gnl/MRDRNA2_/MRDRNA2_367121_c0_seq1.p1 gnl/MRDRNA2_/MRDRNA2_367121_c0~~gnl/MRDRNA2_/MRDRNA2_367121_c0_seq1.p1  ORF type:complete len:100 (-),score=0.03 gnl/MRDRNA2_/MRDRNA2_367121_c0_seq1:263-562(-)
MACRRPVTKRPQSLEIRVLNTIHNFAMRNDFLSFLASFQNLLLASIAHARVLNNLDWFESRFFMMNVASGHSGQYPCVVRGDHYLEAARLSLCSLCKYC